MTQQCWAAPVSDWCGVEQVDAMTQNAQDVTGSRAYGTSSYIHRNTHALPQRFQLNPLPLFQAWGFCLVVLLPQDARDRG